MDTIKEITHKLVYVGAEKIYHDCVFAGIIPYKDANDLVYFTEKNETNIIEGPPGVEGFQHIEANKDFVKCKRSDGLYYFYLRKKKKWLTYQNSGKNSETNYHFYGDGIIYSDDCMMHVVTENCNTGIHKEFAIYLQKEDRFVPDVIYTGHVCGIFQRTSGDTEVEMRTINNKRCKTLLLNRDRFDEENPWALYLIETNEFFQIPFPVQENQKDIKKSLRFFYVSGKYAVLKLKSTETFKYNFYLYDIDQGKYLNFDKEHDSRLDEMYWKPQQMLCTTEYVCIQYLKASHQSEPWWEILSVVDWKPIKLKFTYEISSAFFSNVSVIEDAEIITAKIMHVGELIKQI